LVELGSGSAYQIEVLKKLYPELTILCYDLPAQIFLCEEYLAHALSREEMVGTDETLGWSSLGGVKRGRVHMFGGWQFALFKTFQWDVFWNAASFGEMEPDIVDHYLSYVRGNAKWIYLLQARHGKETVGRARVGKPITFDYYDAMLKGYQMKREQDSFQAHKRLSASGGYFEAIWLRE
jgi:hypothetical protein